MKHYLILFAFSFACLSSKAQLTNGSIAPDWTLMSIDSVEHNLYSYIDSGYQVILDFSATWCGPCWNYHQTGILEELYELYGPNGTNDIRIFHIEADDNTTLDQLYGTTGTNPGQTTQGDWVTGTSYPIIDDGGETFSAYECEAYPTIFTVCPNRRLTETGQANLANHVAAFSASNCAAASQPNDPMLGRYLGDTYSCGDNPSSIRIELLNQGLDTLNQCTIEVSRSLPFGQVEVLSETSWEGALSTYESATVELGEEIVSGNIETLLFNIISEDDVSSNNQASGQIFRSKESTNNIEISLRTDTNPLELSWAILDDNGLVVAEVLEGTEVTMIQETYTWQVSLPSLGCYSFRLFDAGEDGMYAGQLSSWDDVGTVILRSMDGEFVVEELWQYLELEEFAELTYDFEANSISSVPLESTEMGISLYPNPAEKTVSVEFSTLGGQSFSLSIATLTGQIMHTRALGTLHRGSHKFQLDVDHLQPGVHMIRLGNGVSSKVVPFVKI